MKNYISQYVQSGDLNSCSRFDPVDVWENSGVPRGIWRFASIGTDEASHSHNPVMMVENSQQRTTTVALKNFH